MKGYVCSGHDKKNLSICWCGWVLIVVRCLYLATLEVLCSGLVAVFEKNHWLYGEGTWTTKLVYGFVNLRYVERCERLNLFLLQYMRMRGDIIKTYKITSSLEDVNSSQFFTSSNMNNLRGCNLKLYKEHFRKVIRKEFFSMGD